MWGVHLVVLMMGKSNQMAMVGDIIPADDLGTIGPLEMIFIL
jgi:hypothetical protein